jgi:hypothetical protein
MRTHSFGLGSSRGELDLVPLYARSEWQAGASHALAGSHVRRYKREMSADLGRR